MTCQTCPTETLFDPGDGSNGDGDENGEKDISRNAMILLALIGIAYFLNK